MNDLTATVILFDLGGTLYENREFDAQYPKQLYHLLAGDMGITVDDAQRLLGETSRKLEAKTGKHITKVAAMEALGYTRRQVHDEFCKIDPTEYLRPDLRLAGLIERLSGRYRLGMVTNFRRAHVVRILDALGVDSGLFEVLVGEDDVLEIKPHHEPFLKALELLGELPENCVYVADSIGKDLRPAREVGMRTVLVGGVGDELGCVDACVRSILGLEEVL